MTHSLYLTPTACVALPYPTDGRRTAEHALPPIQPAPDIPPLPPQRPYLAQAVAARLQGGDFVGKSGEILPDDRVLRPYGTPMLPAEKQTSRMTCPNQAVIKTASGRKVAHFTPLPLPTLASLPYKQAGYDKPASGG